MKEEEREHKIRKLREISKKDRKEIEEAQSLIKGTEDIIKERPIKEEVKVPEIEPHIEEILQPRPRIDYGREEEEAREIRRETPLEETVEEEQVQQRRQEESKQVQYNLFKQEFEGQKTEEIYNSVKDVYQRLQESGQVPNPEEMNRVNAAMYVTQKREEEIGRGEYGRISEEVSQKLVLTERMGSWLSRMYKH